MACLIFFGWILFFDNMDLITLTTHRLKLQDLQEQKNWYELEIDKDKAALDQLTTNPEMLEKFAREQYHMKRDNEEIFVLVPAEQE